ncbi:Transposon TX1 protein [Smittium culicis]|uniref:Transposon TX1 protein n=1 Tax=Smittium culicis TaxID=133412 RepID=A0A1R1X3Z3_9FUNG|nr:Transposon TX1 protein [Smittium culicis]
MDTSESIRLTLKMGTGLQQAKVSKSKGSRYNKGTVGRMIDNIYYSGLNSRPNWCRSNRFLDLSDHMPIAAQYNLDSFEVPEKKNKINAKKILLAENKFTTNNRFEVLRASNLALDELCSSLVDPVWAQSAQLGAVTAPGESFKTILSKKTLKKIKKRRKKFKKTADRKAHCEKTQKKLGKNLLSNSSKEYWQYIKSCTGNTFHSVSNGPVYGSDKILITEKTKKLSIWNKHFNDLARDTTGNSRNAAKWRELLSGDEDYFPECDDSTQWSEITKALNDTPNNKAPGVDGVLSDIWKMVMTEKSPTSDLAKLINIIIKKIYDSGEIPSCMITSIIVPVPKKGDMKDPDNYRGISLVPTIIKLLAKIVATKLIAKEQVSFRNFEECVAQATTLYEIARRRKIKNLQTWICFVDYSKAYDRVLHMALIHKLRSIGIGGKLLNVIKGMYYDPKIAVRIGDYISERSEYHCGVRQGCPASPILFDLYINDIFSDVLGVDVPGLPNHIPGLLFADDAVVLADSAENLQTSLDTISAWLDA